MILGKRSPQSVSACLRYIEESRAASRGSGSTVGVAAVGRRRRRRRSGRVLLRSSFRPAGRDTIFVWWRPQRRIRRGGRGSWAISFSGGGESGQKKRGGRTSRASSSSPSRPRPRPRRVQGPRRRRGRSRRRSTPAMRAPLRASASRPIGRPTATRPRSGVPKEKFRREGTRARVRS